VIERDLKLIGIDSEDDFLEKVVRAAADRSSTDQSLGDSILLFYRAKAYERVLEIINKALGASLTLPIQPDASLETLGGAFGGASDLPTLAQNVMRVYEMERNPRRRVSEREWETLRMLLELKKAILQSEQGRADLALEVSGWQFAPRKLAHRQTIEHLGILPLNEHISVVTQRAEEFKNYPEPIIRNFATVLLTTMGCLYKLYSELRESSYGGVGRQEVSSQRPTASITDTAQSMNTLRLKARTLLVYAGMLRFRMGTDVYQELSRLGAFSASLIYPLTLPRTDAHF
jgi:nuclear pore complex protein Nup93